MNPIMQGAEPFFSVGNAVGVLVVHGFTGSPMTVRWLAEHIANEGYTVYAPRLFGHGTRWQDMFRADWQDWLTDVTDGYQILFQNCEKIILVGHSMGGCLSLILASHEVVQGVVGIAVPADIQSWMVRYGNLVSKVRPTFSAPPTQDYLDSVLAEQKRRGEASVGRIGYDRWSLSATYQLYQAILTMRERLPQVKSPLLLINAEHDESVPLSHADLIADGVESDLLERVIVARGGHGIPTDEGRQAAFDATTEFIRRILG